MIGPTESVAAPGVRWALLLLLAPRPAGAVQTVMLPAPDGTLLATDIYNANNSPKPVLVIRTPYGKGAFAADGMVAEQTGTTALVVQDDRGTGASQGKVDVFYDTAGGDGRALLSYVAQQPWSNGRVSMTGGSALGIAQYEAAAGADSSLVCIHPYFATGDILHNSIYQGGVLHLELAGPIAMVLGVSPTSFPPWGQFAIDPAWSDYFISDAQAASVHAAGLHKAGLFDLFGQGMLTTFSKMQYGGGTGAKGRQKLVLGPWTHGDAGPTVGQLTFPANAQFTDAGCPFNQLDQAWAAACLSGDWTAWDAARPVHVYVMSDPANTTAPANTWQTYDEWPPPAAAIPLYLSASGGFDAAPGAASSASFTSDPANPCPTAGGTNNILTAGGPYDQRAIESRGDVLVFTTTATNDVAVVVGRIRADLLIAADVPDVDLVVRMTDVYPDGRSMLVAQGIQRARYRDGLCPELLVPNQPVRVKVDLLTTALAIMPGHELRLIVSASATPLYAVNPQNGDDYLGGKPNRIAHVQLLVGAGNPSALVLPFVSVNGKPVMGPPPDPVDEGFEVACASGSSDGGSSAPDASSDGGRVGARDASFDASSDGAPAGASPSGCGCHLAARSTGARGAIGLAAFALAIGIVRRRVRRRPRPAATRWRSAFGGRA